MKLVLCVVLTILLANCSSSPLVYNCDVENSPESPKLSLKGWSPKSQEEYRAIHQKCLLSGVSDDTELAKCIDRTFGVIDGKGCYLIPRADQQYAKIFELSLEEVDDIIRRCFESNLKETVKNYQRFYKCIQG